MDRALKERIIGATVLVVFAVLIVPVFLDGPPQSDEVVSERVPLARAGRRRRDAHGGARTRPRRAGAGRSVGRGSRDGQRTGGGAGIDPRAGGPAGPRAAAASCETGSREHRQSQQPAAATDSPTGMWAVQLGSFGDQQNAERLAADLRKQGFAAFLSQLSTDSGQLHRVRIGPQKDRESAEAMAARLAKAGHKGQVVPHP